MILDEAPSYCWPVWMVRCFYGPLYYRSRVILITENYRQKPTTTDNLPPTTDKYYLQTTDEKFWSTDKLNSLWLCTHLDLRKHCFTVRVVSKWNSLPADVVNALSVDAFKNRLDKFWSTQEVCFNYKAQFDLWTFISCHVCDLDIQAPQPSSSICLHLRLHL